MRLEEFLRCESNWHGSGLKCEPLQCFRSYHLAVGVTWFEIKQSLSAYTKIKHTITRSGP